MKFLKTFLPTNRRFFEEVEKSLKLTLGYFDLKGESLAWLITYKYYKLVYEWFHRMIITGLFGFYRNSLFCVIINHLQFRNQVEICIIWKLFNEQFNNWLDNWIWLILSFNLCPKNDNVLLTIVVDFRGVSNRSGCLYGFTLVFLELKWAVFCLLVSLSVCG